MHRDDDHFPFRQATRLVNEFQFGVGSIGFELAGRHPERMVLLLAIYRHAMRDKAATAISLLGIATSLGRPPETMRRQFGVLVEMGLCRRDGRVMRLADDFLARPAVVAAGDRMANLTRAMLRGFRETGYALPDGIEDRPRARMIRAALDIYLSVHELAEARPDDLMELYVIGAISVQNASGLTHDPDLAQRYGYDRTVPPDAVRRPVSVRALAAIDGLPYATVWRHVDAAERRGLIRRAASGYLLADRLIDSPEVSALSRTKIRYVRRVLLELAAGPAA